MTRIDRALVGLALTGLTLTGCGTSFGLAGDETPLTGYHRNQQPVPLQQVWRADLAPSGVARNEGRQLASAAYDPEGNRVWIGSADRPWFYAFRASDGHLLWQTALPGGTSGHAIFDAGQVVVGSDGGEILSFDGATGAINWRYAVQGAVNRAPTVAGELLFAVDGTNAIYALDRTSGEWRWQYRRDAPGRFAVFGEAPPTAADGRVHVGFSDGVLVTLSASDGAVLWTRDLAPEAEQFEDVDARAVRIDDALFAASVAGGLYALDPADGGVIWTRPLKGVVVLEAIEGDLFAGVDRGAVVRVDPRTGTARWQVTFADHAGAPTAIVPMGKLLAITTASGALHLIDGRSGRPIWRFAPGGGFLAAPTVGRDGSLFALANSGKFFALRPGSLIPPLPDVSPLATSPGRGLP